MLAFSPGLQSYNEVNAWFPEEMAEAGYVVMIVDPQGQGDSENCGHEPDGTPTFDCPSSNVDVYKNAIRSAIGFLLSSPASPYPRDLEPNGAGTPPFNPFWESVDPEHVGIAGHSYGAIASTPLGQEDARVDAIVSYDNLDANLIQGKNSVSQAVPVSGPSVHPCCGANRQDQEQLEMSDGSSRERRNGSARRLAGSMAGECPRPPEMSSGNSPV